MNRDTLDYVLFQTSKKKKKRRSN